MPIKKFTFDGRILELKKRIDGKWELTIEVPEKEEIKLQSPISDSDLVLVDAESLSIEDEFMQYEPKNEREKETKELIAEAIKKGVKNFYKPKGDVSFTDDGKGICYAPGKMPAVGKSYAWYEEAAKEFWPGRNSRLGSKLEYGAFLGVLIKRLVEEGKTVEWAWYAVCCNSRELGHYRDSENAKHNFEPTGSRDILGLCDLANACKVLAWDNEAGGFWLTDCCYLYYGVDEPLACLGLFNSRICDHNYSVGWLVLS